MELYRAIEDFIFEDAYLIRKDQAYRFATPIYRTHKPTGKLVADDWICFSTIYESRSFRFIKIERTFMLGNGTKEHGGYIIEKLESFGGLNDKGFDGRGTTNSIYYIDENGNIRATDTIPKDLKITASEVQAEKTFPRLMKVGDIRGYYDMKKVIAYLPGRANGLPFITDHASFAFAEEPTPEELEIAELMDQANELLKKAEKLKAKKDN